MSLRTSDKTSPTDADTDTGAPSHPTSPAHSEAEDHTTSSLPPSAPASPDTANRLRACTVPAPTPLLTDSSALVVALDPANNDVQPASHERTHSVSTEGTYGSNDSDEDDVLIHLGAESASLIVPVLAANTSVTTPVPPAVVQGGDFAGLETPPESPPPSTPASSPGGTDISALHMSPRRASIIHSASSRCTSGSTTGASASPVSPARDPPRIAVTDAEDKDIDHTETVHAPVQDQTAPVQKPASRLPLSFPLPPAFEPKFKVQRKPLPSVPQTPEDDFASNAAVPSKRAQRQAFDKAQAQAFTRAPNVQAPPSGQSLSIHTLMQSLKAPSSVQPSSLQGLGQGPNVHMPAQVPNVHAPAHTLNVHGPAHVPHIQAQGQESLTERALNGDVSLVTPNVYINGLPPYFPEDQLFALCEPFGDVRSVRAFTRHVGEKPTGYGFVLFEDMEGAARCIEELRKYRNLHPSLSKQVHKIPGTAYVHAADTSIDSSVGDVSGSSVGDDSFKARMEKLHDKSSTNLYVEGLPLSIDESTMAALVAPYAIRSSRFFQTKLSHPPRIIAFVRLESRPAAEEIIERLHGRMVRGWNDAGSRISVRFADTSEQREIRRQERGPREGAQSPNRMTIAEASLLNLRGKDIHQQTQQTQQTRRSMRGKPYQSPVSPLGPNDFELVQARRVRDEPAHLQSSASLRYSPQQAFHPQMSPVRRHQPLPSHGYQDDVDREMSMLLNSLRGGGPYDEGWSGEIDYRARSEAAAASAASHHAQAQANALAAFGGVQSSNVEARAGYTPAEEFILKVHDRAQKSGKAAVGAGRGAHGRAGQPHQQHVTFSPEVASPALSKASMHQRNASSLESADLQINAARAPIGSSQSYRAKLARASVDFDPTQPQHFSSAFSAPNSHTRSTTLAHPPSQFVHGQRAPAPKTVTFKTPHTTTIPQSVDLRHTGTNMSNFSNLEGNRIFDDDDQHEHQQDRHGNGQGKEQHRPAALALHPKSDGSYNLTMGHAHHHEGSPELVSPALTYSSAARTPSTVSPSTPFFGGFGYGQEPFEVAPGLVVGGKNFLSPATTHKDQLSPATTHREHLLPSQQHRAE